MVLQEGGGVNVEVDVKQREQSTGAHAEEAIEAALHSDNIDSFLPVVGAACGGITYQRDSLGRIVVQDGLARLSNSSGAEDMGEGGGPGRRVCRHGGESKRERRRRLARERRDREAWSFSNLIGGAFVLCGILLPSQCFPVRQHASSLWFALAEFCQ